MFIVCAAVATDRMRAAGRSLSCPTSSASSLTSTTLRRLAKFERVLEARETSVRKRCPVALAPSVAMAVIFALNG